MDISKMYKRLKQKYVFIEEEYDVEILAVCALNIDDLEKMPYNEPFMCCVLVAPTIDDIVSGEIIPTKSRIDSNDNCFIIKDIREFVADDLKNIKYKILNKYYKDYVKDLFDSKDEIIFNELKQNLLKFIIKEKIVPKTEFEYNLCPDHYKNVFITSDNHFGHSNIIEYENRDEKMCISGVMEHDNKLIENWNKVVKKDDLVLILGDFSFHKPAGTENILRHLNGDKVLISGNHDMFLENKKFDKTLFKAIYQYKETKYRGQEICLMHYPLQRFKHQDRIDKCAVMLFGHIHSRPMEIPKHSYNVGVDVNNYTPIRLEEAIEKARNNNGGQINGK